MNELIKIYNIYDSIHSNSLANKLIVSKITVKPLHNAFYSLKKIFL